MHNPQFNAAMESFCVYGRYSSPGAYEEKVNLGECVETASLYVRVMMASLGFCGEGMNPCVHVEIVNRGAYPTRNHGAGAGVGSL